MPRTIFQDKNCFSLVNSKSPNSMTTYIARFTAQHRLVQVEQHSIFIWQQESGEIDEALLSNKIIRESSVHFYRELSGTDYPLDMHDISVNLLSAVPFKG